MDFYNLFSNYKRGHKVVKKTSEAKYSRPKKIVLAVSFVFWVAFSIALLYQQVLLSIILVVLSVAPSILFLVQVMLSDKNNKDVIDSEYSFCRTQNDYYLSRFRMVKTLLSKYGISTKDDERIKLLIDEAKEAQSACCKLFYLGESPFKDALLVISPILTVTLESFIKNISPNDAAVLSTNAALLILVAMLFYSILAPVLNGIVHPDYDIYDDFIYDLRQIRLFYSSKPNRTIIC